MPFGFRDRADVRDIRQTDRRTDDGRRSPLNAPPTGRGHNKNASAAAESNARDIGRKGHTVFRKKHPLLFSYITLRINNQFE